jgi:hypothetical protein
VRIDKLKKAERLGRVDRVLMVEGLEKVLERYL